MKRHQEITQQLIEMGFNALEAEIYLYLLMYGEQTGYAIGKGINKAAANVYKAIESLSAKGAIEFSVSNKKRCIAVHWQQLLDRRKQQFEDTWQNLTKNLESFKPYDDQHDQVFQIEQAEQVKAQTLSLINNAKYTLLADIDPRALPWFKPALLQAAERGVEVWLKLYQPEKLKGINIMLRQNGEEIFAKTDDATFTFAADGNAMLMAKMTLDGSNVLQAYRSSSILMAFNIFNGLLYEIVLTGVKQLMPVQDYQGVQKLLEDTAHLHPISTENHVFQQYYNKYSSDNKDQ